MGERNVAKRVLDVQDRHAARGAESRHNYLIRSTSSFATEQDCGMKTAQEVKQESNIVELHSDL